MMKVSVFISVAVVGRCTQVLSDICHRIVGGGLYDRCDRVVLVVNGDPSALGAPELAAVLSGRPKFSAVHAALDISQCEFPALQMLWEHCLREDGAVCYLHTKGVTRADTRSMRDWAEFLTYFNVDRWADRLSDLEGHDCSSVNLRGNPEDINEHPATWGYGKAPVHYSGNFWWSRASHVRALPSPAAWPPDGNYLRWRMMAEMWLCQLPGSSYACAWQSGVDHYQTEYPRASYESGA